MLCSTQAQARLCLQQAHRQSHHHQSLHPLHPLHQLHLLHLLHLLHPLHPLDPLWQQTKHGLAPRLQHAERAIPPWTLC